MPWADHFNTYEEACEFYGVDTPAQAAEDARFYDELWAEEAKDMEAAFGPYVAAPFYLDDEIPF